MNSTADSQVNIPYMNSTADSQVNIPCMNSAADSQVNIPCINSAADSQVNIPCMNSAADSQVNIPYMNSTADSQVNIPCMNSTAESQVNIPYMNSTAESQVNIPYMNSTAESQVNIPYMNSTADSQVNIPCMNSTADSQVNVPHIYRPTDIGHDKMTGVQTNLHSLTKATIKTRKRKTKKQVEAEIEEKERHEKKRQEERDQEKVREKEEKEQERVREKELIFSYVSMAFNEVWREIKLYAIKIGQQLQNHHAEVPEFNKLIQFLCSLEGSLKYLLDIDFCVFEETFPCADIHGRLAKYLNICGQFFKLHLWQDVTQDDITKFCDHCDSDLFLCGKLGQITKITDSLKSCRKPLQNKLERQKFRTILL